MTPARILAMSRTLSAIEAEARQLTHAEALLTALSACQTALSGLLERALAGERMGEGQSLPPSEQGPRCPRRVNANSDFRPRAPAREGSEGAP